MDRLRRASASRRRRWAAALVCVVLVGAATWAIVRHDRPVLEPMGSGMGLSTTADVAYQSVLLDELCVRGRGVAEIERVEPLHVTGGAEITDFSVVFFREGILGASNRRIAEEDEYRGTRRVDRPCGTEGPPWAILVVEMHRPGRDVATVHGLRTWYRIDGRLESVDDPDYRFGICPEKLDPDSTCLD